MLQENITRMREEKCLSKIQLGKAIGVTPRTIEYIEKRKNIKSSFKNITKVI